ncbi:tRNA uridine-5-carboxymethylaminomethyl(34) synthesis GTPase MnmE [Mycoplasma flocculare]|uniref:tRNA modification GTPase MnmE n=2 Tax=Mesomycoplasma flocculare TaxID=2128 RepID=A0A0A8ECV2_MESFC|nr:tRNA uridine-5-carboxymethylaminomethyl(34) synthesis GTPase MnmE [Mesomycoplasma flocculare]MXR39482.1 tRNA uridine-5-carboxymethylaminomethyl(34) synthesis GTPase MnmE [Mycoplasma sp. MF12]AJC50011.1 tRNA modification GTPase TrmE [Mesomycoplasma flocculare ATCC 27399]ENX50980.1 tRNA modification GTPase ThdF/TrmE [Mesomycoplasma flocculare ATCC 27716]MXR05891.1 tRNA uridine-5-carboxymethylaminomethyl(34) synthesis GTPase MnmE [Mesomycoplasma flocculare]MXR12303.1 tRNA uridine-5-carboxymeth
MISDTICAIASGGINQAISIIRISGPNAFKIMEKIFTGKIGKSMEISFGWIHDNNVKIDQVLALWFPGSKNFVGEETVEINAHGGVLNTNLILETILKTKLARLANPGEFSLRAFLNGKIDLVKAQAINDLIHAQVKSQHQAALNQFLGTSSNFIKALIEQIEEIIGIIEVNIDYPEYDDVEVLTAEILLPKIEKLLNDFTELISIANNSRLIYQGIKTCLIGEPNSGKSSLLNILIAENKAIISEIPGTTRDVVEGNFVIDNLLFKVFDTAGIRKTNERIEQIGIEKSFEIMAKADLILHIIDASKKNTEKIKIKNKIRQDQIYIKVYNKADLLENPADLKGEILITAKYKKIENLIDKIKSIFSFLGKQNEFVANSFQISQIELAKKAILEARNTLLSGFGPEIVIVDLRIAWKELKTIFGSVDDENLLDSIFSKFCLGK